MSPRRRPIAFTVAALLAGASFVLGPRPADAQDSDTSSGTADSGIPDSGDQQDRERVEDLVRSLNNPVVVRVPGQLRDRIGRLLSSRHPLARRKLSEMLLDTGTRDVIVEQIITAVIVDRGAIDLLDEVIERLRVEQDSPLGRAFDDVLLRYSDTDLVRRLSDLALDESRAADFRATAATTLGRTGHTEALQPLVDVWGADDPVLRLAASRGFVRIVPFVRTRDDAQSVVTEIRQQQLPLAEVLRRRLRANERAAVEPPQSEFEREYIELARAALPHIPLVDILRLYVGSPLPDLRMAAAQRLREFDWASEAEPVPAQRAAGKALLRALRREEVAAVEAEIIDTLLPFAPALRENVADDELAALVMRARSDGAASRPVRRVSIRMLGALRDRRPVAMLQEEFDALEDRDPELRVEILDALGASGADLTEWLARRVLDESDVRVARAMVLKLGGATDPAAVGVFVQLLKDRHPDERLRSYVVQALASLWANGGIVRARDALIDYGLVDPVVAIREVSANGLGNPRPGEREPVLGALERVVAQADEDMKVRVAAARAVLDLDPDGAMKRLEPMLSVGAVWDVYRNRRTEDLRSSHTSVEDVIADADALWTTDDPVLRERAVQLLQAVVDSGADLWEGQTGRGLPRVRLAQLLLASGRPADACAVAEGLVAASPREGDPRHAWQLLLGRSLRACGSSENLVRAQRELTRLRADEALPESLRASVLLELGHALLMRDDPTPAREVLAAIGVGADALGSEDLARLRSLELEAAEKSEAEQLLVMGLVDRVAENDAQEELRRLGSRAARQIDIALAAAELAADLDRMRELLLATAVLARRTFEIPLDATPEQVAEIVAEARAYLVVAIAGDDAAASER